MQESRTWFAVATSPAADAHADRFGSFDEAKAHAEILRGLRERYVEVRQVTVTVVWREEDARIT